jgi:ppGpp synthetase/RelA/SpoT-type nucleotidyltranferase
MNKPQNIEQYKKWLKDTLSITIDLKTENHYNSIANKIKSDFIVSKAWTDLLLQLNDFNNEYLSKTNYQLLVAEFKPELVTKSFSSFFEKTFRKNIVYNREFPKPPNGGWATPDNWIENTNDILRTFFVVKYLDGVEFLMDKIQNSLKENSLECKNHFEARDEGYYAVHIYTKNNFNIPRIDWDTEVKKVTVELQITTQLQEVIGKLTHQLYESRRIKQDKSDKKWQWNYESEEFTTNYLGHILHYVEGMIMEVRNKQSK